MFCSTKTAATAVTTVALCVLLAGVAGAQVFYMYPEAPVVGESEPAAGATIGVGEDHLLRLLAYGRFNVVERVDLGLEFVVDRWKPGGGDSSWRFGLGGDVKYAIFPAGHDLPFDMSAQVGLGFESGGDVTNVDVPLGSVFSRAIELKGGRQLVPYVGPYLVYRHVSVDGGGSDSDFDVEVRGGLSFPVFKTGAAFVALHIGHETIFFLGFNGQV